MLPITPTMMMFIANNFDVIAKCFIERYANFYIPNHTIAFLLVC